eukprot:scaffold50550_cov60-Phaeocystis_antarctica.AAC.3
MTGHAWTDASCQQIVPGRRPPDSPRELTVMCPGHYGCFGSHGNGNARPQAPDQSPNFTRVPSRLFRRTFARGEMTDAGN